MNLTTLINRIKNIVLTPTREWDAIASETATVPGLFTGYIAPLALIGPVASFIGTSILGFAISMHGSSLIQGLIMVIISYGLNLAAVFLTSLIINELAPNFSGTKDPIQALKAIAYSSTPGWLAGIFLIIPFLGILSGLAGLYGLYILYLGLPKLMKVPQDKALVFTIVVVILTVILFGVTGTLTGWLMLMLSGF